jgi:pimeloyl-ACP methyl ester carboxylesterase
MQTPSGRATLSVEVTDGADLRQSDVLFLHAGVTDKRSWRSIAAALSDRYRCITFDARGFGETTYAPEPGWSPVGDALQVLDAAGCTRAVVVGSSLGGRTAVDFALAHPERVIALVLIAPAVRGAPYPDPTEQEASLDEAAEKAAEDGRIDDANRVEAQLWLDGPTSPDGRVQGAARQLFLDMNGRALRAPDPGPPAAYPDAWPRLREIAVPTLVLVGDLDTSDLRAIGRQLAAVVPDATFTELSGVAHLPQLEAPSELSTVIGRFLDSLS